MKYLSSILFLSLSLVACSEEKSDTAEMNNAVDTSTEDVSTEDTSTEDTSTEDSASNDSDLVATWNSIFTYDDAILFTLTLSADGSCSVTMSDPSGESTFTCVWHTTEDGTFYISDNNCEGEGEYLYDVDSSSVVFSLVSDECGGRSDALHGEWMKVDG